MLDRLLAVWLVVLIALPFTAPFQTFDLGGVPSEAGVDQTAAKDVTLAAAVLVVSDGAPPLARFDVVRTFACGPDYYRILPTVLRL
jgi:hypothetical protein